MNWGRGNTTHCIIGRALQSNISGGVIEPWGFRVNGDNTATPHIGLALQSGVWQCTEVDAMPHAGWALQSDICGGVNEPSGLGVNGEATPQRHTRWVRRAGMQAAAQRVAPCRRLWRRHRGQLRPRHGRGRDRRQRLDRRRWHVGPHRLGRRLDRGRGREVLLHRRGRRLDRTPRHRRRGDAGRRENDLGARGRRRSLRRQLSGARHRDGRHDGPRRGGDGGLRRLERRPGRYGNSVLRLY